MMTAHLPSGYLVGRLSRRRPDGKLLLGAAITGALLPDIDMLAFLLDGSLHHHAYPTHWPLFWLGLCGAAMFGLHVAGLLRARDAVGVFLIAVLVHMVLDSVAAPLFWLRPFAEGRVELFPVPAAYSHWIVSMMLHWTFLIEMAIWFAGGVLFVRDRRRGDARAARAQA